MSKPKLYRSGPNNKRSKYGKKKHAKKEYSKKKLAVHASLMDDNITMGMSP